MKKSLLFTTIVLFLFTACSNLTPQERQARATVKTYFQEAPEGDSYEPIKWGSVEFNAPRAGTGTKNPFFNETGTLPSAYT